ncbi:MAG: MFS transporter [Chloroflexi bacterium]|nr:MAG: MFS transporter [Chloroflexota bacterium]
MPSASRRLALGPCAGILGTVWLSVLESRRALTLYVAAGAAFAAIAARGLLVPLYAHDMGASRFEVGALFSVATFAAALLSLPSGLLIDRIGARTLLWTSLILSAGRSWPRPPPRRSSRCSCGRSSAALGRARSRLRCSAP